MIRMKIYAYFLCLLIPPSIIFSENADFFTLCSEVEGFSIECATQDQNWLLAKSLYERSFNSMENGHQNKIPKALHLIWLGSSVPERYFRLQETLQNLNPDFTVKIWTDEEVRRYQLINRAAFECAKNYGEKSDILRYEILFNEGGIYLDGDFLAVKSFEDLTACYDFFMGACPAKEFCAVNALIGSVPHHPILEQCIKNIHQTGCTNGDVGAVMETTGPFMFTRAFVEHALDPNFKNIALPCGYFYPWPAIYRYDLNPDVLKYAKEYTYCIHLWHCSWQPGSKNYRK